MNKLLFGTAGIPLSTPVSGTIEGIKQIKALGLGAMEIEFVRQIYLNESSAAEVALAGRQTGIALSVHAPYYLNLNALDPQKRRISQSTLYRAARIASITGAKNVVFHPGYYLNSAPQEAFGTIYEYTLEIEGKLEEEKRQINLAPETTGKLSQFGNLEEILRLCLNLKSATPCIDFAHLHAYQGFINTHKEFLKVLEAVESSLGKEALKNLHLHVSGIKYGHRGELKHLVLEESDFNYRDLLKALIEADAGGVVICESPNLEQDALLLQSTYLELKGK